MSLMSKKFRKFKETPKISVFIPTHNRALLLERSINSVLTQKYPNIELIVVDDGSSDNTWEILNSIDDKRVRIFRNETPQGACAARNRAIKAATGDLITGLDDDDHFDEKRIVDLWEAYDPNYSFIFAKKLSVRIFFLSPIVCIRRQVNVRQLLNYNIVGGFCLASTSKLKAIGGFDEELPALQDYDLWVRLLENFGPAKMVFSDTYIVDADHGGPRITNKSNRILAYQKFLKKHAYHMSRANMNSLALRQAEWEDVGTVWKAACRAFFDGNLRWAIRFIVRLMR